MCVHWDSRDDVPLRAIWRSGSECLGVRCAPEAAAVSPSTAPAGKISKRQNSRVASTSEFAPGDSGVAASRGAQDLELVRRALAGQRAAVDGLLVRLRNVPRILAALNIRIGWPLQPDELADVGQDAVVLVWRKLDTFNGRSSLETWFYAIARNEFMNALRSKNRRGGEQESEPVEPRTGEPPPSDPDLEQVHVGIERLPPAEAEMVRLHHFDGLELEEAAARLGLPPSTAKSRYYRGIDRLQIFLRGRLGSRAT
jgi:RNA polymerase sigma-70 factor (ECF subfamily)